MKKILILLTAIIMPVLAGAQAQINTKKVKISDFTQKTTKIVLTGNQFYDAVLEDEVAARWRVSPYEFCSIEEFERIKSNDNFYFLLTVAGQFKKEKEPGITFLTLVKGGSNAKQGISKMLEVVSLPFAAAEEPSGREIIFLPAFLDIIQNHTLAAMDKDITGYSGLSGYTIRLPRVGNMEIVFSEDDLSSEVDKVYRDLNFDSDMIVTDEDSADEYMSENKENTVVSYTVVPTDAPQGSYCYKMLIDAHNHELYFFKRHRIGRMLGKGFLEEDIKRINSHRGR